VETNTMYQDVDLDMMKMSSWNRKIGFYYETRYKMTVEDIIEKYGYEYLIKIIKENKKSLYYYVCKHYQQSKVDWCM